MESKVYEIFFDTLHKIVNEDHASVSDKTANLLAAASDADKTNLDELMSWDIDFPDA